MLELGFESHDATPIYKDNRTCLRATNSACLTSKMHHLYNQDFASQDWTKRDFIQLVAFPSHGNCSAILTKQFGKILFARQMDLGVGSFTIRQTLIEDFCSRLLEGRVSKALLIYRSICQGLNQSKS